MLYTHFIMVERNCPVYPDMGHTALTYSHLVLDGLSLVHTMLVIMLVVLRMVMQEQLAIFVHASEDYAS